MVVGGQDADGVQVPLGDVLERPGVLAHAQQHGVAVDRALPLAARLEVVGRGLQQALGVGEGVAGPLPIADPQQRLSQVEVRQRRLVGQPGQPRIAQHALPLEPGRRAGPRRLELDGRQHRAAAVGEDAGRLAVMPQLRRAERPLERALAGREEPLGLAVPAEREQQVARLARPVEGQVGADRAVHPGLIVAARRLHVLQQLPVEPQRLPRAPRPQRAIGPLAGVDLVGVRGHQAAPAASSTISSARRRLSAVRASEAAVTTWLRCSRGRYSRSSGREGSTKIP